MLIYSEHGSTWAVGSVALFATISPAARAFFIFIFFKIVFTEIYFRFHNLQVYTPTARQEAAGGLLPVCGAAGPLPPPCRGVGAYMQLKFVFYRMEAPTARHGGGRGPTARQGVAGSAPI